MIDPPLSAVDWREEEEEEKGAIRSWDWKVAAETGIKTDRAEIACSNHHPLLVTRLRFLVPWEKAKLEKKRRRRKTHSEGNKTWISTSRRKKNKSIQSIFLSSWVWRTTRKSSYWNKITYQEMMIIIGGELLYLFLYFCLFPNQGYVWRSHLDTLHGNGNARRKSEELYPSFSLKINFPEYRCKQISWECFLRKSW